MKKENKIYIDSEDGIEEITKKIKDAKETKVVLHIPEDALVKSSLDNFHDMKREAIISDKEILIESVDPYIEELAERAGIKAINPIFGKEDKLVSDIIPRHKNNMEDEEDSDEEEDEIKEDEEDEKGETEEDKENEEEDEEEDQDEKAKNFFNTPKRKPRRFFKKQEKIEKPVDKKKRALVVSGTLIVLILMGLFAVKFLPKADITITLKKTPITFAETIKATTAAFDSEESGDNTIVIPGEMLVATHNIEQRFPASGEEEIETTATGELVIFNEFSSNPQILVATTRFVAPSGQVFRLDERVTVPGAEVIGNEIAPSEVKVKVTADKPGDSYNVTAEPNEKWTIPGFKEAGLMDRYNGFYAKAAGSMTGGFSGVAKVPTKEDVEKAKKTIEDTLYQTLKSQLLVTSTENLKSLKDSEIFEITKVDIDQKADEDGTFGVFAEGRIRKFVFNEDALGETVAKKNTSPIDYDFNIIESELKYDNPQIDWENEEMVFNLEGSVTVEPKVDEEGLRNQLVGQTEAVVKPIIFSIPDLEKARISLWPFWVSEVPNNPKDVNIKLE